MKLEELASTLRVLVVVMEVWRVIVRVRSFGMPVPVSVLPNKRRLVNMTVMPVVMTVGVFVLELRVDVRVFVSLGDMQYHAGDEQRASGGCPRTKCLVPKQPA
ncbi:MAG TPA: hypothetical protein VHM70_17410 [Polyangiaceae bacterium]|nr:hypothetical protein [Polyangiaceae bacterium]